jgi:hypothetical protein
MFPILPRDKKISIFLVFLSLLPLPIASSQEADVPSRLMFFEPGETDVTIHSLRLDQEGNVLDAPPTYRQFFLAEMQRSIGL